MPAVMLSWSPSIERRSWLSWSCSLRSLEASCCSSIHYANLDYKALSGVSILVHTGATTSQHPRKFCDDFVMNSRYTAIQWRMDRKSP